MNRKSLFGTAEIFVAAAVIGAHAGQKDPGFRQRDVKFLIELFSNWIESSDEKACLTVQNTQVLRYLSALVDEGYAKKLSRQGRPFYRLTRVGLLELISRLTSEPLANDKEHFFFLYYFISNYRPRLEELVKKEGRQFPLTLKLELESLLDEKALVHRELRRASKKLIKLEARARDAREASALTVSRLQSGSSLGEAIKAVEKVHPYELNSQKTLSELIMELPKPTQSWEMTEGNLKRADQIWDPASRLLRAYIKEIELLL